MWLSLSTDVGCGLAWCMHIVAKKHHVVTNKRCMDGKQQKKELGWRVSVLLLSTSVNCIIITSSVMPVIGQKVLVHNLLPN